MTPEQLAEVAQYLGDRLHVATVEVTTAVHKHTGQRLTPEAIDEIRRKLAWNLAMGAAAVVDQEQKNKAAQQPTLPRFCQRWCCRSGRWFRRWMPLPLSLLAVVHALAGSAKRLG